METRSRRFTLFYRFETTHAPSSTRRLKIEINTREHFSVLEIIRRPLAVDNPWFAGAAEIPVFQLNELLGTKMRALYQRKKGRDLYDHWIALRSGAADPHQVVDCFQRYMLHEGLTVSRAEFEANLAAKIESDSFKEDVRPLIASEIEYDPVHAARLVGDELLAKLPGAPWKGSGKG